MNLGTFLRLTVVAILAQVALAAWGLTQVPAGTEVPIHWGPTGEADGFADPVVAFLMVPVLSAGVGALLALVPRIEPRAENLRRSAGAYRTVAIALVAFLTALQAFVVLAGTGTQLPVGVVFGVGTGVLFAVIGNVMGTVRSNFLFGVRTPWTLSSELSWYRTHRVVGRLFVVGGLLTAVVGLLGQDLLVVIVLLGVIGVILPVAFIYSYRVWKTDPDRRDIGSAT